MRPSDTKTTTIVADSFPTADGDSRSVGGRRLLRFLGKGGMSEVFLGYDPESLTPVAIKLLADHLADSKQFVNRFYREARMSQMLVHPNLVRGFDVGYDTAARKHFLVLEFVDGPSCHAVLTEQGALPVGVVVTIGIDVARALSHLHRRDYVHRDVKPDNILLHPDGTAKLGDLGLAKRLGGEGALTHTDQSVGTPQYMSYEQSANSGLVDGRSDLFALGCTLYHLLTGELPFPGSTQQEIAREKARERYRPLAELAPQVPEVVDRILARLLTRDIRFRYQTAEEVAADLEATQLGTAIDSEALARLSTTPAAIRGGQPVDAPTLPVMQAISETEESPALSPTLLGRSVSHIVILATKLGLAAGSLGLSLAILLGPTPHTQAARPHPPEPVENLDWVPRQPVIP